MNSAPQLTPEICTIFKRWALLGQAEVVLVPDPVLGARLHEAARTLAALAALGSDCPAMLLRPAATYQSIAFLAEMLVRHRRLKEDDRHVGAVRTWLEENTQDLASL